MPVRDSIPIGQTMGRLTLLNELPQTGVKRKILCRCTCGKETEVLWQNLKQGKSTSCGCYAKEVNTTHGASRTPLFNCWHNMVTRCTSPSGKNYSYYGGRGITVAREWLEFESFRLWAILNGHVDGLTIERKDVNGNYCPDNCLWVPMTTQCANRRKRVTSKATYLGVVKAGKKWAAYICVNYDKTHIGSFVTPEEARDARTEYIKENNLPHYVE